jgi:hypothetical protein
MTEVHIPCIWMEVHKHLCLLSQIMLKTASAKSYKYLGIDAITDGVY